MISAFSAEAAAISRVSAVKIKNFWPVRARSTLTVRSTRCRECLRRRTAPAAVRPRPMNGNLIDSGRSSRASSPCQEPSSTPRPAPTSAKLSSIWSCSAGLLAVEVGVGHRPQDQLGARIVEAFDEAARRHAALGAERDRGAGANEAAAFALTEQIAIGPQWNLSSLRSWSWPCRCRYRRRIVGSADRSASRPSCARRHVGSCAVDHRQNELIVFILRRRRRRVEDHRHGRTAGFRPAILSAPISV